MTEYDHFSEAVSLEPNPDDGCVWLSIGDSTRECIPPEKARDMANGLEHLNRIGTTRVGPSDPDPETERLITDLRDAAADVEHASGDDR